MFKWYIKHLENIQFLRFMIELDWHFPCEAPLLSSSYFLLYGWFCQFGFVATDIYVWIPHNIPSCLFKQCYMSKLEYLFGFELAVANHSRTDIQHSCTVASVILLLYNHFINKNLIPSYSSDSKRPNALFIFLLMV